MLVQARLMRSRDGQVVHREGCEQLHRNGGVVLATPWTWSHGREMLELRRALPLIGSQPCEHCRPMTD
jgi:hypothetical protein